MEDIVDKVNIRDLLEAGCHFGHPTRRWNPKMKPYIWGARNGIYIFDLPKSMVCLESACNFLNDLATGGGEVLFVGTKRQAQEIVKETAETTGMHYICERWLGGTLTNIATIRKSLRRMKDLQEMEENGALAERPKKEASNMRREMGKLQKNLSGIVNMNRMPEALFVVDVEREHIAVREANRLGIPVVAIVDTNCDPDLVTHVIPSNDDAVKAIQVILTAVTQSLAAGREIANKRRADKEAEDRARQERQAEERAIADKAKAEKEAAEKAEREKARAARAEAAKAEAAKADAAKAEASAPAKTDAEPKADA
jgi:small subunit ribosomal protein S2